MAENTAIHPNPAGPIRAESPYQRKLARIRDDVKMAQDIAPTLDVPVLETIIAALNHML